ncbi:MAG: hypothetical protein Tsb0020_49980 [Haliangiales bacterium]
MISSPRTTLHEFRRSLHPSVPGFGQFVGRRAGHHASGAPGAGYRALVCVAALAASLAVGCGGRYPGSAGPTTPHAAGAGEPGVHGVHGGDHDEETLSVADAALPFAVLRAKQGGQEVAEADFVAELAAADAVCIGEVHRNPHHHWAQLAILERLSEARPEVPRALGMEMFQRPFQAVLDDYAAGRIDEAAMLSRTGWETRWGYDYGLYRPMVELAIGRKIALLALNIGEELRKRVSQNGLDGVAERDRERLPEVVLDDADHRAWWDGMMAAMGGHGHGGPHGSPHGSGDGEDDAEAKARAERTYSIQVLWDETMAETAAGWLSAGDERQIVILAGSGHCHDSAIVRRLKRRGVENVVSVLPILNDLEMGGDVSAELAEPINDYLFVMTP